MQDPHQDITTKIYNFWAEEYKKSSENFIFPWNMFDLFLWELSGKKILDIGCAFGRDVLRLRNLWYEAYGIDISKNLIDLSDWDIKDFLQVGNMSNIENMYQASSFDGIFSSATLLHVDKEIALKILEHIYNLLDTEWIFFCTLKISESWETLFKESLSLPWVQKKYVYYVEEEILSILKNIWFKILNTHILETKNDNWISIICKK